MESLIFTAFVLGLLGGVLPGPILTSGFLTILGNRKGFQKIIPFPLIAGSIEICIGLSMFFIGREFFTDTLLIILSFLGALNLIYLAYKIFSARNSFSFSASGKNSPQNKSENYMAISYTDVGIMTLFNGPLYMFWVSTCLPILLQVEKDIPNGGIYFIFIMVFGVMITTWLLFFLMHTSRSYLQNPQLMKTIPLIISGFFILLAGKMLIGAYGLL